MEYSVLPKISRRIQCVGYSCMEQSCNYKLLWNLCKKKGKLWVQWVHIYYGKGCNIWEIEPKYATWMVKKILKSKKSIEEIGIQVSELCNMATFSIKWMYQKMRGKYTKVPWRRLVCNNHSPPKWLFILNLTIEERLSTLDRLAQ